MARFPVRSHGAARRQPCTPVNPMKTIPLLAAGALAALAGCNFSPRYDTPPKTDSGVPFKEARADEAPPPGWKVAEPGDPSRNGPWWRLYEDPDLTGLEEQVAISNQTVAAAEANYRSARALASEAGAALFPSLAFAPSLIRSQSSASASSNSSTNGSGGSPLQPAATRTLYTLPLEAAYQLDFWGRVRNAAAQGEYSAQASAAEVATALLSTRSQLAQDYFQLRALDEQRRILATTLTDYEASRHLVQTLFDNGMASEADLSQADTQLRTAEAQATDLGVARAQLEHAIAVLVGVPPSRFSLPVKPFRPRIPATPLGLPSSLLERRPDIAAAERQVAAANAAIGYARAGFFPSVTLGGSLGYESSRTSTLFEHPNRLWSLGPSANLPLFEGGALKAQLAQAHAQYDATVAQYRQAVLSAFQSVEDNLSALRILSVELQQQHAAVVAAQREVELSVTRYEQGLDSYVNVITAQNTFLTNRQAELQVQLRQVIASVNLVNNLGGGWDRSQLKDTEKTAANPPVSTELPAAPAPAAVPVVANPPPLPETALRPDDLLKQNRDSMAPAPPQ
jgi:NodT family efflux transporter outer membrane factor (OMF) lipoprotein